ncbi:MAG: hypothetical protein Q8R66_03860 [Methanobacteriaceae archaeon]|nr:hypothetical protein [Methanobacteriaceae archaeon]
MDIYGAYIGCSSLYVIQTNSVIQPDGNYENLKNLGENLVNGARHLNMEKLLGVTFGTIGVVGGAITLMGGVAAAPETGGISLAAAAWGWSGIVGGATGLAYTADMPWFTGNHNF